MLWYPLDDVYGISHLPCAYIVLLGSIFALLETFVKVAKNFGVFIPFSYFFYCSLISDNKIDDSITKADLPGTLEKKNYIYSKSFCSQV